MNRVSDHYGSLSNYLSTTLTVPYSLGTQNGPYSLDSYPCVACDLGRGWMQRLGFSAYIRFRLSEDWV